MGNLDYLYWDVPNYTSNTGKDEHVKLSAIDQRRYPKLTQYVRYQLPKLSGVPKIVKNLKTFGSLTADEIRRALT